MCSVPVYTGRMSVNVEIYSSFAYRGQRKKEWTDLRERRRREKTSSVRDPGIIPPNTLGVFMKIQRHVASPPIT